MGANALALPDGALIVNDALVKLAAHGSSRAGEFLLSHPVF
ncbi:hypothetical protein [Marinobacter changyiensis]|nr:hypothetical protein [Marinobacter changyiensis]